MRALSALLALLVLSGCKAPVDSAADPGLLAEAKSALAERERKIGSYQLAGTVEQDGQTIGFEFVYLAPNRMRGTLLENGRTFSYDGKQLFELQPQEKTLHTWELKVPEATARVYLTQLFAPFVPEGYRAPLLDLAHATARRVVHPKASEAVELSSETKDESGSTIRMAYVYRWPAMDLLERRLQTAQATMTTSVEEEDCVARLRVCLPKRLAQRVGDREGAVTTLSRIALEARVPAESFTLPLPEGFTAKSLPLPGAGG